MCKKMLILVVSVLLCSSPAWATDVELYRWDFDTTGDAQNWDQVWDGGAAGTCPHGNLYREQADTYDGTNYINLGGQYADLSISDGYLWPPTIDPATEGGALRLNTRGDNGYYEATMFGGRVPAGEDITAIQFNSTTYNSIEHSQLWVDWYLRSPDMMSVVRLRTDDLVVRGDVQDGEWTRTTYTVADIDAASIITGSKWWAPGELGNLNRVEAVFFVGNVHCVELGAGPYTPYFLDDIRLIPEPATIALLGLGGLALLRRRK